MVAAGLLARNALEQGLDVPDYVKTSLAPGSRVVTEYLKQADLLDDLEGLGYNVVGYGCTTCIGNAGPLADPIEAAIDEHDLWTTSVLSGNRNFEARIHPKIRANYLASPPLVVAYGLAGKMDIDLENEPIGTNDDGEDVFLGTSGRTHRRSRRRSTRTSPPSCSETSTRASSRATSAGRPSTRPRAKSTTGTTSRRTSASHRSSRTSRSRNPASPTSRMRAVCSRSATP